MAAAHITSQVRLDAREVEFYLAYALFEKGAKRERAAQMCEAGVSFPIQLRADFGQIHSSRLQSRL
jgi:hypothetical protein